MVCTGMEAVTSSGRAWPAGQSEATHARRTLQGRPAQHWRNPQLPIITLEHSKLQGARLGACKRHHCHCRQPAGSAEQPQAPPPNTGRLGLLYSCPGPLIDGRTMG
jgi:hypothetical protein